MANPSISEVLQELTGAEESVGRNLQQSQMAALCETSLLGDLTALLTDSDDVEARAQAAKILAAIANSQAFRDSPLAHQLGTGPHLGRMLEVALRDQELLVAVLVVVLGLIEPKRGIPGFEEIGGGSLPVGRRLHAPRCAAAAPVR